MDTKELLDKFQEKQIKRLDSFFKKTIFESNNLEKIKAKYGAKFYGLKQGFDFIDHFIKELKLNAYIAKSDVCVTEYKNGEVVVYDKNEKKFLTYPNEIVEDVFLKIYLETHFELDKNELYIVLYREMLRAKQELDLKLVPSFLDIGNIINWFLFILRDQIVDQYENKFSLNFCVKQIPEVFLEASKDKHEQLMKRFLYNLVEKKIIFLENDLISFFDIENSIKLIYGNFDLFWFNRPEKQYIFRNNFELDSEIFEHYKDLDYSNDDFIEQKFFAKKIKINNIIFGYVISSMFCYLALHTFVFTNSLCSDFFIKKYLENV